MIDPLQLHNMHEFFCAIQDQYADRDLLCEMDGRQVVSVSTAQFFLEVDRYAAWLNAQDLCGTHVGLFGVNRSHWLAAFCAIFQVGSVAILLSPDLNAQELAERAAQVDLQGLYFDHALLETVEQAGLSASLVPLDLDHPTIPSDDPAPAYPEADKSDLACILFTSGTTATAKAVMLSHQAMIAGSCHRVIGHAFASQLAILPFHHIAGIASVLNTWYLNAKVCLGQDIKYLYRYLSGMQPDYMLTVPSILQALIKKLQNGGSNGHLLGWDLHLLGCGGAKFQPDVLQFLLDRNIRILQSYGATEAGGLGFDWEMTPDCANTIGKPCPEIETKLVDGELYLRSPSIMMGYYGDPDATAAVIKDGWYATGDLCVQDAEGYLYLTGRKNNRIILSNGENVSPEEIESRLQTCPAICEILVEAAGDQITAIIYPAPADSASDPITQQKNIRQAVSAYNHSVPLYKQIAQLRFTDTPLPKTSTGKLVRGTTPGGD